LQPYLKGLSWVIEDRIEVKKASKAFDIMGLVKNEFKSVDSFKIDGLIDEEYNFY
jgi:hypothetical protein